MPGSYRGSLQNVVTDNQESVSHPFSISVATDSSRYLVQNPCVAKALSVHGNGDTGKDNVHYTSGCSFSVFIIIYHRKLRLSKILFNKISWKRVR